MGCDEFYLGISTFARAVAMTANGGKHMANRTGKSRLTGIVIAECLTCQLCEWTTNIWDRKQNEGVLNGTGIQVGSARERERYVSSERIAAGKVKCHGLKQAFCCPQELMFRLASGRWGVWDQ